MTEPVIGTVRALQLQNAILKRALKWYAEQAPGRWASRGQWVSLDDPGGKARRALARAEKVKP